MSTEPDMPIKPEQPQSDLGISVLKSACSSEARDIAVEWAKFGTGIFLDGTIFKDVPMLGTIVKLCTMAKTIHNEIFARKVLEFLRASPTFTEAEKVTFLREHLEDSKKAERLGDAIVLILDRLDDYEKTKMLAKIFAAHVKGRINYAEFRRLANGICNVYTGDLEIILAQPPKPEMQNDRFMALLEPAGFASTGGGSSRAGAIGTQTNINELGKLFQKCMWEP